ncbi:hypothetical protein H9Q74_010178 [Fusarium xylarioides]|nr:hypothetical protein H9Q71_008533 [Fusarium xylarioides]KAG5818210.1 hypothetical protein H9Q74_010178 [Fusarium xylarioides]
MHHHPLPFPLQDPLIRAADLMALMRDDLVEHCRRPSFKILRSQKSYMMNDKEIGDHIVQIVKDTYKQIHVPSPARKRRMSASAVTSAVIMQHPFAEKPLGPALHELDIGQLKENRDNKIAFNIKDQATGWFHILLSADGQLLPGFHAGTVARLGVGPCAGLVVRLEIIVGKFRQLHMHFKFGIRNGGRPVIFMDLIVPLDYLVDAITLNSINADDMNSLAPLRMFNAIDISELANHAKGSDVLGKTLENLDMSNPVNHIHLVAKKRNIKLYPSTMQNIASAVTSQVRKKEGHGISRGMVLPGLLETFDCSWPDIFADVKQFTNPYADYLVDTRYDYADLTFGNLGHIDPGGRPDPSAAEEQEMQDHRASTLLSTPIRAVVWRDEFSSWKPKNNDLEV